MQGGGSFTNANECAHPPKEPIPFNPAPRSVLSAHKIMGGGRKRIVTYIVHVHLATNERYVLAVYVRCARGLVFCFVLFFGCFFFSESVILSALKLLIDIHEV